MTNMPQQIAPATYRVGAIGIPNAISVLLLQEEDGWTLVDTGVGMNCERIQGAILKLLP
jgi:glyoxylase-like metal-dependent hydrolase (beta-lactamase superfamily II)